LANSLFGTDTRDLGNTISTNSVVYGNLITMLQTVYTRQSGSESGRAGDTKGITLEVSIL
jgi:hypothetical protein